MILKRQVNTNLRQTLGICHRFSLPGKDNTLKARIGVVYGQFGRLQYQENEKQYAGRNLFYPGDHESVSIEWRQDLIFLNLAYPVALPTQDR